MSLRLPPRAPGLLKLPHRVPAPPPGSDYSAQKMSILPLPRKPRPPPRRRRDGLGGTLPLPEWGLLGAEVLLAKKPFASAALAAALSPGPREWHEPRRAPSCAALLLPLGWGLRSPAAPSAEGRCSRESPAGSRRACSPPGPARPPLLETCRALFAPQLNPAGASAGVLVTNHPASAWGSRRPAPWGSAAAGPRAASSSLLLERVTLSSIWPF